MAYQRGVSALLLVVVLIGLFVEGQSREAGLECEDLSPTSCAFAVDSRGARCVLETFLSGDGEKGYQCQTSEFRSSKSGEYVENDFCVKACGVDRMTVGISTDEFFLPGFVESLCSLKCQMECTNIVDLFSSIFASAAKGASLGKFCNDFLASQGHRRQMRANPFSMSPLTSLSAISPSSSFADAPSSFLTGDAEAPTSSLSSGVAAGPSEASAAPTNQFPFF